MKQLPEEFRKNGLPYTLIKRNDYVALFGVGGDPDKWHYEVVKIYKIPERKPFKRVIPAHEQISSNEKFGNDGSICTNNLERAERYYNELTQKLTSRSKNALHKPETTFA